MKILIATPLAPSQTGGPAQYALGLSLSLKRVGHDVETYSFHEVIKYPPGIRHIIAFMQIFRACRNTELVIILDTVSVALPAILATFFCRKRSIIRIGGDFLWEQYIERTKEKILLSSFYKNKRALSLKERVVFFLQKKVILPHADFLAFSTDWQKNIWNVPYQLEQRKTAIIGNAYTPEVGFPQSTEIPAPIVWVGRELALKNTDLLDAAILQLREKYPALEYRKYSSLLHHEVIEVLRNSRAIIIPSLSEVSPNLALEALSLHVPVLLTKDCGLKEVLGDAVTWVDPLDVENIAFCIEVLLSTEGYAEAKARASAFHLHRTYDDVAQEFTDLFTCI